MLTTQRDFTEESQYKNSIEGILCSRAAMVSDVDGVTGAAIERHVKGYRLNVAVSATSRVRIIDRDKDVHAQQVAWKLKPDVPGWYVKEQSDDNLWNTVVGIESLQERVSLMCNSIENIHDPARFFDADLMGSVDGQTGKAIDTVLGRQAALYSSDKDRQLKKALIFTFSLRGTKEAITLEWLEDLIGRRLNSICSIGGKALFSLPRITGMNSSGFKGNSVHIYDCNFIKKGRVEDVCTFYYNEGHSPMVTGIVVYR